MTRTKTTRIFPIPNTAVNTPNIVPPPFNVHNLQSGKPNLRKIRLHQRTAKPHDTGDRTPNMFTRSCANRTYGNNPLIRQDLANQINWEPNPKIYSVSARNTPMRFGWGRRGAEGKGRKVEEGIPGRHRRTSGRRALPPGWAPQLPPFPPPARSRVCKKKQSEKGTGGGGASDGGGQE